MPATDQLVIGTSFAAVPPAPPDTARTWAMVAPVVPAGVTAKTTRYSSATEMLDDGWVAGQKAFDAASQLFSQTPTVAAVTGLVVIKRETAVAEQWTIVVTDATDATIELLDGVDVISTFVASSSTITAIRDGLVAAMVAGYTAAPVSTDTLTVTQDIAGIPIAMASTATAGTAPDIGVGPTIAAVGIFGDLESAYAADPFWGVLAPGASDPENDEARRWVGFDTLDRRCFFFGETNDVAVYDSGDVDNLAVDWLTGAYDRVNLMSAPLATEYMQADRVGRLGGIYPGTRSWDNLPITGSLETAITSTRTTPQTATMAARGVSYPERQHGPQSKQKIFGQSTPSTKRIHQIHAADNWFYVVRDAVAASMESDAGVNLTDQGLRDGPEAAIKDAMAIMVTEEVVGAEYTIGHTDLGTLSPGEVAVGDFKTNAAIIVTFDVTPKLEKLTVNAVIGLAPAT